MPQMALFHSFLWLSNILLYSVPHLLDPVLCQRTSNVFSALIEVKIFKTGEDLRHTFIWPLRENSTEVFNHLFLE